MNAIRSLSNKFLSSHLAIESTSAVVGAAIAVATASNPAGFLGALAFYFGAENMRQDRIHEIRMDRKAGFVEQLKKEKKILERLNDELIAENGHLGDVVKRVLEENAILIANGKPIPNTYPDLSKNPFKDEPTLVQALLGKYQQLRGAQ